VEGSAASITAVTSNYIRIELEDFRDYIQELLRGVSRMMDSSRSWSRFTRLQFTGRCPSRPS
jgi:hypothetical protein